MSDIRDIKSSISYKDIFDYELNRVNNTHIADRNLPDCCYPKVGRLYLLRFLGEEEYVAEHIICNDKELKDICIDYSKRCVGYTEDKRVDCLIECFARKIPHVDRVIEFLNKNDYYFKSDYYRAVNVSIDSITNADESAMLLVGYALISIYRSLRNMFYAKKI